MAGIFAPDRGVDVSEREIEASQTILPFSRSKISRGRLSKTPRKFYMGYNERIRLVQKLAFAGTLMSAKACVCRHTESSHSFFRKLNMAYNETFLI